MTLHAFSKETNKSLKWVALPLEFVDWMALHVEGRFVSFLASIDPYGDILIPSEVTASAPDELVQVRKELRRPSPKDVPIIVDEFGEYGLRGAISTVDQLIELIDFAARSDCKIVSVGD